jgi:NADP-reducing hydrogenase subunit HndD
MVAALRRLGFHAVFDTDFTADLTIMEEATELLTRLQKALVQGKDAALPMFTSCSPGWIKYMEHYHPDMLAHLSTCKSPQQMFGALAKTYYAERIGRKPEDIFVVSIMPCTAKKFEARRPEMNASGFQDVDIVLTTRELARMIERAGIDFRSLPDESMDLPLGMSTGAADIFANTGGVMEAALRTGYEVITGKSFPFENLHVTPLAGLEGIKVAAIQIQGAKPEWGFLEGVTLRVAVAHTLANAERVIRKVRSGEEQFHFIEVMTCPGGCIGGGGQPRMTTNEVRQARIRAIYAEDEGKKLRKSHENPAVIQLYRDFLGAPLSHTSHHLLHTEYVERQRI